MLGRGVRLSLGLPFFFILYLTSSPAPQRRASRHFSPLHVAPYPQKFYCNTSLPYAFRYVVNKIFRTKRMQDIIKWNDLFIKCLGFFQNPRVAHVPPTLSHLPPSPSPSPNWKLKLATFAHPSLISHISTLLSSPFTLLS